MASPDVPALPIAGANITDISEVVMSEYGILYGRSELKISLGGDICNAVGKRPKLPGNTPRQALDNPIGCAPLTELAEDASSITVIIPDATRAWQKVSLMAEAVRTDLGRKPVTWVIGGGQHRLPTPDEVRLLLGGAERDEDQILSHDSQEFVDTGRVTSGGNRVTLHKAVAEADLVVSIGGITYHELAGFSGGRKSIIPGVSGRKSIITNHSLCLEGERVSPAIGCGKLEGNPVHGDMMEYARLAMDGKRAFILNVIPDETGEPWSYVAGDMVAAWEKGTGIARDLQTLEVEEKLDWVIVSPGGYPYDIDLYQATKSVTAVMGALADGGAIVMVSELEDGIGPGNYGTALELSMKEPARVLQDLKEGFTIPAFCAFKLVLDLEDHPSVLVTGADKVPYPGEICSSMGEAIEWLKNRSLLKGKGLVLPAGNCVVLKIKEGA